MEIWIWGVQTLAGKKLIVKNTFRDPFMIGDNINFEYNSNIEIVSMLDQIVP